jgi:hypothetical protein
VGIQLIRTIDDSQKGYPYISRRRLHYSHQTLKVEIKSYKPPAQQAVNHHGTEIKPTARFDRCIQTTESHLARVGWHSKDLLYEAQWFNGTSESSATGVVVRSRDSRRCQNRRISFALSLDLATAELLGNTLPNST